MIDFRAARIRMKKNRQISVIYRNESHSVDQLFNGNINPPRTDRMRAETNASIFRNWFWLEQNLPDRRRVQFPMTNSRTPSFTIIVAIGHVEPIEKSITQSRCFCALIFIVLEKINVNVIRVIGYVAVRWKFLQIRRRFSWQKALNQFISDNVTVDKENRQENKKKLFSEHFLRIFDNESRFSFSIHFYSWKLSKIFALSLSNSFGFERHDDNEDKNNFTISIGQNRWAQAQRKSHQCHQHLSLFLTSRFIWIRQRMRHVSSMKPTDYTII